LLFVPFGEEMLDRSTEKGANPAGIRHSALYEEWCLNSRLNYIYQTGDDVFFIVNQVRSPEGDFWSVFAKLTHTFEL